MSPLRHVLGFGNELHGDDGFAAEVCRRLSALPLAEDVRVFDVGTRGLDALALFDGCREVVLIDARAPAGAPGAVTFTTPSAAELDAPLTGHLGGVESLVRAAAALGLAPRLRLVTAEAAEVRAFAPGLSPPLRLAVDVVVERLALELGRGS